jgi:hypothetical protein
VKRILASVLIVPLTACTTSHRSAAIRSDDLSSIVDVRTANLEHAARLPWTDEGACAVREAAGEWKMLAERCFHVLDHSRIQFRDVDGRCPVANADAATIQGMVGLCLLIQPELAIGAIIIVGVVIVGAAIAAELATVKKPGCYCYCLNRGVGPNPYARVEGAHVCRAYCRDVVHAGGMECGGVTEWFTPKVSLR